MITRCRRRHVSDRVATLTNINSTRKRQCRRSSLIQRSDVEQAGNWIVSSLRCCISGVSESCRQEIRQRDTGGLSQSVVGDLNLESDRIAFIRCAVSTGQCLHGDQIGDVVDDNFFFKVIPNGRRIGLVSCCGRRYVGDRVAAFTNINGTRKRQCRRSSLIQRSDVEQAGNWIVSSLRCCISGVSESCRQEIRQRDTGGLSQSVVGDLNLESDRIAFIRCTVSTGQRFYSDEVSDIVDNNFFFKIIPNS